MFFLPRNPAIRFNAATQDAADLTDPRLRHHIQADIL